MKSSTWQLQEAKNRFSEVVELARTKGAQTITKHGRPAVMVVSIEEFRALKPAGPRKKKRTLLEILRSCPDPDFFKRLEAGRNPPDYGRAVDFK